MQTINVDDMIKKKRKDKFRKGKKGSTKMG
jgi:hypothetical protein